ncbi:MAG: hypothetical protein QW231_04185 [Candidatus Bathyarchaeia archaeon]
MKKYGILFTVLVLSLRIAIAISTFIQYPATIYYFLGLFMVAETVINLLLTSYLLVRLYTDWRFSLFAPTALCLFLAVFSLSQGAAKGYDSLTLMGFFHLLALIVIISPLFTSKRTISDIGSLIGGLTIIFALTTAFTSVRLGPESRSVITIQALDLFFLVPYLITYGFIRLLTRYKIKREVLLEMSPENLYGKLLDLYTYTYGSGPRAMLERRINTYVKQGLKREEAIRKIAEEETIYFGRRALLIK